MNKVSKNWEILVRLILQREQLRDADQVDGVVVPNFAKIRSSVIFAGRAKLEELYELHNTSETCSDEVRSEDNSIDDGDDDDDCVILETDPFNVEMIRTTNNHSTMPYLNSAGCHYFQNNGTISRDCDEDECAVLRNKPFEKELTDDATLSMNCTSNTEDCRKLKISKTKSRECIFIDDDDDFGSTHGNCVLVEVKASDKEIMNRIIALSRNLSLDGGIDDARKFGNEDDLSIIAERGQVACRDYPHSRHLCAQHPFNRTPHETYCYKEKMDSTLNLNLKFFGGGAFSVIFPSLIQNGFNIYLN